MKKEKAPKGEMTLRTELQHKEAEKKKKDFLDEYNEATKRLGEKYGIIMVPVINYTEFGALPVFALDKYNPDVMGKKPETDGRTDSND